MLVMAGEEGESCLMKNDKVQQGVRTVWWEEDAQGASVCMVDQSLLPQNVVYLRLRHEQQVADAITTLKVRGAPAIGVTAAFGMALALYRLLQERSGAGQELTLEEAQGHIRAVGQVLSRTGPTAVNLFWAIERMQSSATRMLDAHVSAQRVAQ